MAKKHRGHIKLASGKKNYFRHYHNAFEDEKIQKAIDLLGYQGYAYYFILLELLAKKCEETHHNPIIIHQQTLRKVWRKQTKSCKKVIEKLQQSGLFVATFNESFVEFDIPNLLKYIGSYSSKFPSNTPNKRKEKEIKEKEIKKDTSKEVSKNPSAKKQSIKKKQKIETFEVENFLELVKILPDGYMSKWEAMFNNAEMAHERIGNAIFWNLVPENRLRKKAGPRSQKGWISFIQRWLERDLESRQVFFNKKPRQQTFDEIRTENNKKTFEELIDFVQLRDGGV